MGSEQRGNCVFVGGGYGEEPQPSTPPEVEGLLPCPFCGGRVEIRHDLAVVCDDCDAAVHLGGDEVERTDGLTVYAEEATAYLWNRRSRLSRRAEPDGIRGWGSCIDPATGLYLVTTRKPQSEDTAYTLPVLIGQPQEQVQRFEGWVSEETDQDLDPVKVLIAWRAAASEHPDGLPLPSIRDMLHALRSSAAERVGDGGRRG